MPRKKVSNPVLDEHIPIFQRYIDKWQPILNLNDYRIDLVRKARGSKTVAEIETTSNERVSTLWVGKDFGGDEVNEHTIEAAVLHELLHLRNHEMLERAYSDREYTDAVEGAEHSQVYVFERLLLRLLGDKPQPEKPTGETSAPRSDS